MEFKDTRTRKFFSLRVKLMGMMAFVILLATICLMIGASFLTVSQMRDQNQKRLDVATHSIQRSVARMLEEDIRTFEAFRNKRSTAVMFKGILLSNYVRKEIPLLLSDLGIALNAERMGFYLPLQDQKQLQLNQYYSQSFKGTIVFNRKEEILLDQKLYAKDADGVVETSVLDSGPLFPETFPIHSQTYLFKISGDQFVLSMEFPYQSAFDDENYGMNKREVLGKFLLEKTLGMNLNELDKDMGVSFNLYSLAGQKGQGQVTLPDIDPTASDFVMNQFVERMDRQGERYDVLIVPLRYQNMTLGYLSGSISQKAMVSKVHAMIRLLVEITLMILTVTLLVSWFIVTGFVKPIANLYANLEKNVRELEQAEQALKNSERRLADIISFLPDVTFAVDLEGKVILWNRAAEKFTGVSVEDILGKGDYEYAIPFYGERRPILIDLLFKPAPEIEHLYPNIKREGSTILGESYTQSARQGEVYLTGVATQLYDAEGKVIGAIETIRNITERKNAEEALRRLNSELDRRVLDRTARLEAANKELAAFAYTVSHDLRAPLRHIDGFLELLKKKTGTDLDEQSHHYMGSISEAVKKMGLLIDNLLTFSRMGRNNMSYQSVSLEPLVRMVIHELELDVIDRKIEWRIGGLPEVSGDAAMLHQVLVNLISNAVKFTRPREQGQIEIGSLPDQDKEVVFFVRDNGVGFDMTYVDKLFGVFQRLHRADEFEGTGIGLANVHRIITRHGGRTWAEGKVDQGATFFFSLPHTLKE